MLVKDFENCFSRHEMLILFLRFVDQLATRLNVDLCWPTYLSNVDIVFQICLLVLRLACHTHKCWSLLIDLPVKWWNCSSDLLNYLLSDLRVISSQIFDQVWQKEFSVGGIIERYCAKNNKSLKYCFFRINVHVLIKNNIGQP